MSHGGDDSARWMISYSDFMTLLMVLFLILYSMSQLDNQKYDQLADGLNMAFYGPGPGVINPNSDLGDLSEGQEPDPVLILGMSKAPQSSHEVAEQLTKLLNTQSIEGMVSVQNNIEGVLISASESLLFLPGSAELRPEAYPVLESLASILQYLENDVRVIGHTNDSEPLSDQYPTRWELSLARAMTIVHYLTDFGIEPERLIAAGRGEHQPLFPNDTSRHRDLNSRAEIIVIYPKEDNAIQPNTTHRVEPKAEP